MAAYDKALDRIATALEQLVASHSVEGATPSATVSSAVGAATAPESPCGPEDAPEPEVSPQDVREALLARKRATSIGDAMQIYKGVAGDAKPDALDPQLRRQVVEALQLEGS